MYLEAYGLFITQAWLERTPGLEVDGFNFWRQYQKAVGKMLKDMEEEIEVGLIGTVEPLHKGHLSDKDTVCSPNHMELCTNLPLN